MHPKGGMRVVNHVPVQVRRAFRAHDRWHPMDRLRRCSSEPAVSPRFASWPWHCCARIDGPRCLPLDVEVLGEDVEQGGRHLRVAEHRRSFPLERCVLLPT